MAHQLSLEQREALQRLFDTGIDRANTMLNYMTEWPIHVRMTPIEILSPQQLYKKMAERVGQTQVAAMELVYRGEFEGIALLIFPPKAANILIDILVDEQRRNLDRGSLRSKTLSEVGNIFLNGLMGSLSNVIKGGITYMAPRYQEGSMQQMVLANDISPETTVLFAKAEIQIEQQVSQGSLILFFMVNPLEMLLADINKNGV